MRGIINKRILIILMICVFIIIATLFIYYSITPYEEEPVNISDQIGNETNGTAVPFKFPRIVFPWTPKKPSAGSGGSSGKGGSSSGNATIPKVYKNYTLFINSTHALEVSIIYTINDVIFTEIKSLPFSLNVQENTYACISETTRSGTIRWLMEDGTDCPFSDCSGRLYSCNILMDRDHSITLRQYS